MNFFKSLFGGKGKKVSEEDQSETSPYMTTPNLPVDEQFTFNFKKNGGKFLYCENMDEVYEHFENILVENDWFETNVVCFEENLYKILNENKLIYQDVVEATFSFSSCESLIADDGSILFSSNQFKHLKPNMIPDNMIVFAFTSQLRPEKGEGMSEIKRKYSGNLPTNITTLKNFEPSKKQDNDFLNYGSIPKNLYLLLLEDL